MKCSEGQGVLQVGIVCPCDLEYETCRRMLRLIGDTVMAGRTFSSRREGLLEVAAVRAGPGKIHCASATQLMADLIHPHCIIDTGGAGALSDDLRINDVVCVKSAFEYDVCPINEFSRNDPDLVSSTVIAELTGTQSEALERFSGWMESDFSARLVVGDLASGERNVTEPELKKALSERLGAIACNWETAAVLRTAQLNSVRALSFRVITDMAGGDMKEELQRNWARALQILFTILEKFLFSGWLQQCTSVMEK